MPSRAVIAEYPDQIAAMIMEPMTSTFPAEGYLEAVRRITEEHGIVLVFDEMLTGFRFAPGGAQEYFGVTPDLAAFGKALSNGFPLSAITGRADILDVMPTVFFSGTFGGETLSLAAAKVVLDRYATGEPTRQLAATGQSLLDAVEDVAPGRVARLPLLQRTPDVGVPAVAHRGSRDPCSGEDASSAGDAAPRGPRAQHA